MLAIERQKRILNILKTEGAVSVSSLSRELCVTEETIRRDLEKLENQEVLLRTHGGAVPIDERIYEMSLGKRKSLNTDKKEKLAKEAVKHIRPHETIFLDASTTTFFIAKELKKMKNITVITNSLRIINELNGSNAINVVAIGGKLTGNESFTGIGSVKAVRECHFANKVFFSSRGIMQNKYILESSDDECAVKYEMLKNSEKTYFLCDSSKFSRVGSVKLAMFSDIDVFITESAGDDLKKAVLEAGADLIEV